MMCGMRRKRDCLAAAAMGPTVLLSSSHPIMSPMFPIVASILDVKRETQNSRVGATGIGSDLGFCSKRRSRSQIVTEAHDGVLGNMILISGRRRDQKIKDKVSGLLMVAKCCALGNVELWKSLGCLARLTYIQSTAIQASLRRHP
jgi:hypothetical protein